MSKYLKLFETTSDYQTYISGGGVVLPNVSVAEDAPTTVYYKPVPPPFFAKLTLNNGEVVELEGSGYLTRTMVSNQYKDTLVSAEIGKLCTGIGYGAFENCSGLTSITIPNSVTSIDGGTFKGCSGLTSIVVDSANTVYDSRDNCNAVIKTSTNELIAGCKNSVIPTTVTSISWYAFENCTGLTSITIPSSVTSIGRYAFSGCSGLTSITIPDSVTNMDTYTFQYCTGLTSVTIGSGVTSISKYAFQVCTGLTSVTIGSGVTSIGESAFDNCSGLTSITCNAMTAPTITSYTFFYVKRGGTLTVPSGSTGYNVWMGTGNYYLGKYGWTKVEQ